MMEAKDGTRRIAPTRELGARLFASVMKILNPSINWGAVRIAPHAGIESNFYGVQGECAQSPFTSNEATHSAKAGNILRGVICRETAFSRRYRAFPQPYGFLQVVYETARYKDEPKGERQIRVTEFIRWAHNWG